MPGESEDAKTPLCTTWRYGFARSRRDLTIGVAKGRTCSSRFSRPWCRARGDARKRRTGPPGNTSCFSVVFRMATCEREIAKTGRRSISEHGIGRSHQDLAIRSLGSRVNPAFAQNNAVDAGGKDPTPKCGPCSGVAKSGGRRMPKHRRAQLGGMVLQDLSEI